jgi:hypothetical protein
MARNINYIPTTTELAEMNMEVLCKKAFSCGRDLRPSDRRARWIDSLKGDAYRDAVDAYHSGQMNQYENECW